MTRPKIVVTHRVHAEVLERLRGFADVVVNETSETWPRAETIRRCADAFGMMAFMPDSVDQAFLQACPKLKIVSCALKGFDNFDLAAARAAGVAVSIVPDLLTAPTAELAVGLAIALQRNVVAGDADIRSGRFAGWRPTHYGFGLDGSNVAILGLGAVGRAIAARLNGFGCRLVGHDPAQAGVPGLEAMGLDDAVANADLIFVAVPLTTRTRHLVSRELIQRTRPGTRIVNIGRGSVVDETAVAEALMTGHLGGYAADVFELEDWALSDRPREVPHALLSHPTTLFTPHLGSAVERVRLEIEMRAADNLEDACAGRPPRDAL